MQAPPRWGLSLASSWPRVSRCVGSSRPLRQPSADDWPFMVIVERSLRVAHSAIVLNNALLLAPLLHFNPPTSRHSRETLWHHHPSKLPALNLCLGFLASVTTSQGRPVATGSWKRQGTGSPPAFGGSPVWFIPWFKPQIYWASASRTVGIHFCCLKSPNVQSFVMAAPGNDLF